MGSTCSSQKKTTGKGLPEKVIHPLPTKIEMTKEESELLGTELHFLPFSERRAQLEEWLHDVQEHNRERMRKEMLTDLHSFILNNVLLCVQFYANFDTALSSAKEFKKTTEAKMNEKLMPMSDDGMILGERKSFLIHGMGQQLVQNYIYRDDGYIQKKKTAAAANEGRKRQVTIAAAPDKNKTYGDLDEPRSTFTCDSILPFEFIITWENLEVYKESEWFDLKESPYTSAKGSPTICRVCLEETDDKNKIPRGFVRVRVVDTPVSLRPIHPIPLLMDTSSVSASGSMGYAAPSFTTGLSEEIDEFRDTVQEVRTESDLSTTESSSSSSSSETDTDSDGAERSDYSAAFRSGKDFMNDLRAHIESNAINNKPQRQTQNFSIPKSLPPVDSDSDSSPTYTQQPQFVVKIPPPLRRPVEIPSGRMIGVIPQRYKDVVNELALKRNIPQIKKVASEPTPPQEFTKPNPPKLKLKVKTAPPSYPPNEEKEAPPTPEFSRKPKGALRISDTPKQAKAAPPVRDPPSPPLSKKLIPKLGKVDPPSPPPISKNRTPKFDKNRLSHLPRNSLMLPASPLARRRKSKSLPSLAPPSDLPPPPPSDAEKNGFDTLMPPPLSRSRSNSTSVNSDDISHRWRQQELKRLWQFLPKRRTKAAEPLSASCFQKIQIEVDSDDDDVLEIDTADNSGSGSESDITDSDASSTNGPPKDLSEPKFEDRTYLNSIGFSADFCSEFKQVGVQLGVDEGPLRSAVILGTTIRCAITQQMELSQEQPKGISNQNGGGAIRKSFKMKPKEVVSKLYMFTPSLFSKNWPQKPLIWWKGRMLRDAWEGTEKWPTRDQVDQIEEGGCHLIPLGNRSIHSTQTENVQQTLVWSVAFPRAENVLLDSFLHVQWRCLTFSALVFRAFLAPLGPLGIGLEHIRNIIYFMCHEEYGSWNYEQPAIQLKTVLDRLYDCLGRGDMPSFFVVGHNLLKNIPTQNLRKVQAYLSRVRNNLTFHVMFMIRNLVQVNSDFYAMPKDDFKKLYDYMTVSEKHILYLVNPLLAGITTEDLKKEAKDKKLRKKREKQEINQALLMNGELIDTAYGDVVNKGVPKLRPVDHEQRKLRRKRERWMEKQQKIKAYEEEEARLAAEAEKLPQERKNSIDLDEKPLKQRQFSAQRLALILKYFIKHFIKMAAKSYQFQTYGQASMYAQHVENLLSLLCELPNEADSLETEKFKEDAKALRDTIGIRMIDYVQEKLSRAATGPDTGTTSKTYDQITGILSSPPSTGIFAKNWELRTLPTPEISERPRLPSTSHLDSFRNTTQSKQININGNNMARSLASISTSTSNRDEYVSGSYGEFQLPRLGTGIYAQRKNPEIKWNSNPNFDNSPRIRSQFDSGNVSFGTPSPR